MYPCDTAGKIRCFYRFTNIFTSVTVKECSDQIYGVMSQCVLMKTVLKPSPATASNLVMKINTKLGGVPHKVIPDRFMIKTMMEEECPTIVLGVDITHPTPMEERAGIPSVAAVSFYRLKLFLNCNFLRENVDLFFNGNFV